MEERWEYMTEFLMAELNGFDSLSFIGGTINISNNASLSSLMAFNANFTLNSSLDVYSNPLLSICNSPGICNYLYTPSNPATISGNATGCATRVEVEDECGF